ncbi:MAG: 50S ribosomal protein L33 [Candidatus Hydrogenedentes bacterium]|nr:50S ribosomal protein L33 [Candidatus Hydrogenedentota bacterium]
MAKKSKENRPQIILECTEAPGTSRYYTTKNVKNSTGRLERRKYNPTLRKVTLHREKK